MAGKSGRKHDGQIWQREYSEIAGAAQWIEFERRRAEQFRVILETGSRIVSILDVDEIMSQTAKLIRESFGYFHIHLGLIHKDRVTFKPTAGVWHGEPCCYRCEPYALKVGEEGICGLVAGSGDPMMVPDVSKELRHIPLYAGQTGAELVVPIKFKGQVTGVLEVESEQLNAFDESDVHVLQSLANYVAVAIENARLRVQAEENAVAAERGRLARELHDAVTQTLFSANLIAEVMPRLWERDVNEGRRRMEELRQLTRGALAEMRTLLVELRPTALLEASLGDLLRQLAEAFSGRTRVPVSLDCEGRYALPPDVQFAFYRIAQEALNNVAKHAGAKQVQLNLRLRPVDVELRIRDDGLGFNPARVTPGRLGLGIMHERAQAIGAKFQCDSQVGRGTEIAVIWRPS
ncbi:MAG: GAF domain-containing sensor histidine kinase [Chloroflexi bacterium]|nr:GAF domain-containing sensor histidine kinase [Chloroflexota bacterium]